MLPRAMKRQFFLALYSIAFVPLVWQVVFVRENNDGNIKHIKNTLTVNGTDTTKLRYLQLIQHDVSSLLSFSDVSNDNVLLENVLEKLQTTSFRYFVYDNPNIVRLDVRKKAIEGQFSWPFKWGQRYKDFSTWEIRYLEVLESSPWRTYNVSQADFVLIPIPWCALVTAGGKHALRESLSALYQETIFQDSGARHVIFTFLEQLFEKEIFILNGDYYKFLSKTLTVAKNYDTPMIDRLPLHIKHKGYWTTVPRTRKERQFHPHRAFSLSWIGAATDPPPQGGSTLRPCAPLSLESFLHNKSLHFFYQTVPSPSLNNSTQFRHAINDQIERAAENNDTMMLLKPSSVGWGLPANQWWQDFGRARFCLVIRGDNPASRSLWRAIRHGCIPVIISDFLPFYSPAFKSLMPMQSYAVVVDEFQYLQNPIQTLNQAISNLTLQDILSKIDGVNLMQRLIMPHHPQSLFVQAFGREALLTFTDEYYQVQANLYGETFNTTYNVKFAN